MKSFKQFLVENDGSKQTPREFLESNAPDQVGAMFKRRQCLLRGGTITGSPVFETTVNGYNVKIFTKAIRGDRESADIPQEVHEVVDDTFEELGFGRPRSESLFAVSATNPMAPRTVKQYGPPQFVFPASDDTDYLWSNNNYTDLYAMLEEILLNNRRDIDDLDMDDANDVVLVRECIKDGGYEKSNDINAALDGSKSTAFTCAQEIMITGASSVFAVIITDEEGNQVNDVKTAFDVLAG